MLNENSRGRGRERMIVNDRITDYINSLERSRGQLLTEIASKARKERVPVIREETASFLISLVESKRPAAILEIGTAVGYSTLLMAGVMPENCRITTIEKYEKRIPEARETLREPGRVTESLFSTGMPEKSGRNLPVPMTLSLWTRPRDSILYGFPKS